jgi:phosphoribosylaminoimidazole-succinocarboxamide synthase
MLLFAHPRGFIVYTSAPVFETFLEGITSHRRGKVRDIYEVDDLLLIVTTDRISAYDCVLGSAIPDKGKVLTQLSAFWFDHTADIVANHMVSIDPATYPESLQPHAETLAGRSMLVQRARPVPIECVARGYLAGSGWHEYQESGEVCGVLLPVGLRESDRLPEPIFTPATKADSGHDINISEAEAAELVGRDLVNRLRDLTLALYRRGAQHAESCGIIVADTKLEFGLVETDSAESGRGESVILIDEILTPDSSRFWPKERYAPGQGQASFDKQFVRNYLDEITWNRQPPVPELPPDIVEKTREKYLEAFRVLSGRELG